MNYDTMTLPASALSPAVRRVLANTFVAVGAMLGITALTSYLALDLKLGLGGSLGLLAVSIALLFATRYFRNSGFGLVLLAAFAGVMGVSLGPVLGHYLALQGGASIVTTAAGLTALATFGCAGYAITTKRDFSRWGAMLFGATLVLLAATVISIFVPSVMLQTCISAVATLLFMAWLLYDVGAIVNGQEDNYISAAIGIYLDILNLFTHLLRLVGLVPGDD